MDSKLIRDVSALRDVLSSFSGIYLVLGNSRHASYDPSQMPGVTRSLKALADRFDEAHGKNGYLIVSEGDHYRPQVPDVSHAIRAFRERAPRLGIHSDALLEWQHPMDEDLEYAMYVSTLRDNGTAILRGVHNGQWVGAASVYFGSAFQSRLSGIVLVGGGDHVTELQVRHAWVNEIPITYLPAVSKNGDEGKAHAWIMAKSSDPQLNVLFEGASRV